MAGLARDADDGNRPVRKIVSGGQTGADRAGLDAAMQLGILIGGWCPQGRRAADGPLPMCYPLDETPNRDYLQRTEWNVRDSDGTVLLVWQRLMPGGGTAMTKQFAEKHGRPCLVIDVSTGDPLELEAWCVEHNVRTLNVAGPSEGPQCPIYEPSLHFLLLALPRCALPVSSDWLANGPITDVERESKGDGH
eukprot:TRINITY_DN52684_c0_g1_i1.p1 TRINITY_DN52684_c0_g1~~TRINITY_DN52684_c0_g1_i1.p1  ORF type:complete len:215 (-),score=18.12 TRINITY_DN52684_c0_g1_i1:166-741(-)